MGMESKIIQKVLFGLEMVFGNDLGVIIPKFLHKLVLEPFWNTNPSQKYEIV